MPSGYKVSIGSVMLFIVVVALQLVLFEGVWHILVIPPITIVVLALNLGLFFVLVRPPALEPRIVGMLLASVAAFVAIIWYLTLSNTGQWGRPIGRMTAGLIGTMVVDALNEWASTLSDQEGVAVTAVQVVVHNITTFEFAFLDLLGLALVWAGGWLDSRIRKVRSRAGASMPTGLPPLDDRAATPL